MGRKPSEVVEEICRGLGGEITRERDGNVRCTVTIRPEEVYEQMEYGVYLGNRPHPYHEYLLPEEVKKRKDEYVYFGLVDVEKPKEVFPIPKDIRVDLEFEALESNLGEGWITTSKDAFSGFLKFVAGAGEGSIEIESHNGFNSITIRTYKP